MAWQRFIFDWGEPPPALSGTASGSTATSGTVTGRATRLGTAGGSTVDTGAVVGTENALGTASGSTVTTGTTTGTIAGQSFTSGAGSGHLRRLPGLGLHRRSQEARGAARGATLTTGTARGSVGVVAGSTNTAGSVNGTAYTAETEEEELLVLLGLL